MVIATDPSSPSPRPSQETHDSPDVVSVEIREAKPEELTEVVALVRRNLLEFSEVGDILATTYRRLNHIDALVSVPGSRLYVAADYENDHIVGAAFLAPLAGLPVSEGICEIRDLVIDASHRRRGIGRMLFMALIVESKKLGYHRVYLETTPQMEPAQRLFKSVGFKPIKQHQHVHLQTATNSEPVAFPCYFVLERL